MEEPQALTPRIGEPRYFDAVRSLLIGAGYTASALLDRAGLYKLSDVLTLADRRPRIAPAHDALEVLTRVFFEGYGVPFSLAESLLGGAALEACAGLGLVYRKEDALHATVSIAPVGEVFAISDRENPLDDRATSIHSDVVFSLLTSNAQRFLSLIPRTPCEDLLEICCGAGGAAILGAKHFAKRTHALDIAERSVLFAEFNARLNGLGNMTAIAGDLYAPVEGKTFDRIFAHPPFVPEEGAEQAKKMIFRDAGGDGEEISRRLIQELPGYLRPGGVYVHLSTGSDREDARFEQRIRRWLGDASGEFDVMLISAGPSKMRNRARWDALRKRFGMTYLFYGLTVLQRRDRQRPTFTQRRTGPDSLDWQFAWWSLQASTKVVELGLSGLLAAKPRTSRRIVLNERYERERAAFVPAKITLELEPHPNPVEIPKWAVRFLELADGTRTSADIAKKLKLPLGPDELANFIAPMVADGFLEVAGLPPLPLPEK